MPDHAPCAASLSGLLLLQELSRRSCSAAGGAAGYEEFPFDSTWRLRIGNGVPSGDIALQVLKEELQTRFKIALREDSPAAQSPAVSLEIQPGSVTIGEALDRERDVLAREAYRIELAPQQVRIVANASARPALRRRDAGTTAKARSRTAHVAGR